MKFESNKKMLAILMCVVLLFGSMCFLISPFMVPHVSALAEETDDETFMKHEVIDDFLQEGQEIIYEAKIYDFADNEYLLYEMAPKGYAIYSLKGDASIFLEGSMASNSPFFEYREFPLIYSGFGEYYYEANNKYYNILTGEKVARSELTQGYYLPQEVYYDFPEITPYSSDFPDHPDPDKTVDLDGFIKIKDYDYFSNLAQFPDGNNTCAIVAICILLGYLDEYVCDDFIPDSKTYFPGEPFVDGSYFKIGEATTQTLHDYLLDNFLHTILGIHGEAYPMANAEIKKMLNDYLSQICGDDFKKEVDIKSGALFNTHKNPRKYINAGHPTLITMTSFKITDDDGILEKSKYHTVVAYGYNEKNDTFLVHAGWDNGVTWSAAMIVSEATIYSYNTVIYPKG